MAKKYYAVRKGVTPGIYLTWADCKKQIDGFSGAEYKGFATIGEAEAFISGGGVKNASAGEAMNGEEAAKARKNAGQGADAGSIQPAKEEAAAVAYVDGSYHAGTKEYSYGAVIFYQGREEHFSEKFSDPEQAKMRNVAGEIEGSMCAMRYCLEHQIKRLDLYYDYEGIEKWCTGAWKANKAGTIAYRDFYRQVCEQVEIRFCKVKGHSGDTYNDLADLLAKQAVGNV